MTINAEATEAREAGEAAVKAQTEAMAAKSLTIPCPTCGSLAGFRCYTMGRRAHYTATHARRYRDANKARTTHER